MSTTLKVEARVRELEAALGLSEWGPEFAGVDTPRGTWDQTCPACEALRRDGHEPGCKVAAALAESKKEE
jgi:hypothetical protein